MSAAHRVHAAALGLLIVRIATPVAAEPGVDVTYLWHLEQPVYWPAPNAGGERYETAWDSIVAKRAGAAHPQNDLEEIFGKPDRVAVYQGRTRDVVDAIRRHPNAGVQVAYTGGLIENIGSLGAARQLGYGPDWASGIREARRWTTSGGHPRLDVVQFAFHHALIPLIHPEVLRKELALYRAVYDETWGGPISRGFFPSEMAFAEHTIPQLVEAGIDWVIVSNHHMSRACDGYPFEAGSGGDCTTAACSTWS